MPAALVAVALLVAFATAPQAMAQATVQYYAVPSGAHPHDVAPAADGGVWYTAQHQEALGRLDPTTGAVEHIHLSDGARPHGADQRQAIRYAHQFRFQSVEPLGNYLAKLSDSQVSMLRATLADKGLVWGAAGLPVEFRGDEHTFQSDLKKLSEIADGLRRAGVTRVGTWLSPGHNELTYLANFKQHVRRLRAVAEVLAGSNLRFGLEYVGPKTSWTSRRYAFIHTMAETKELLAETHADNMGLVLDSWHWYTAGERAQDIVSLTNKDVVAVDLNDAPAGIPRDQQIDSRRELPLASGVIDLKAFLSALVMIGYDGPIRAEPISHRERGHYSCRHLKLCHFPILKW